MKNIVLFHPFVPKDTGERVSEVLKTRWIGQGPKVEEFENKFKKYFTEKSDCVAVGSGTDALHLSYLCAGIGLGDEVIAPVFTCTATNIPLLYIGANIKFADVNKKTMNIDVDHVKTLVNDKTKAIICVHYGGLPCDMSELIQISNYYNIPIIQDSAHGLGAKYDNRNIADLTAFSCFSFQAIKSITTGDGGMLVLNDGSKTSKAKRIRWFGIDREEKQKGIWENDITEIGYKYQMTDIAATMGICGLESFDNQLDHRRKLYMHYRDRIKNINSIDLVDNDNEKFFHSAWLCTALVENRLGLEKKLKENNIESAQVHYRNDNYSIFSNYRTTSLDNMNDIEDKYIVLPLHSQVSLNDVDFICDIIKSGW
ncbi:MAG: DegT/DnrJ/EryC1/StrS family aminotransferase [Candidatus Neomarinimicrobiota bacterium]